jgi:hypothetical protein
MERFLFFLVIAGILFTIYMINKREGFQDSGLNVPLAGPPVAQLPGEAKPFDPPSTNLLAPPPGQIASVGSKPYEDPVMQKASANRINNVYVTLQGFLKNEAPNVQSMSDPSIQLPLATARSDSNRLNDELLVLKRNPGLESSLTVGDVNSIEANLGYLQKKWRLSANTIEPFQNKGLFSMFSGWFSESFQDMEDVSGTESEAVPDESNPVTMNDLNDLSSRIAVETIRLNASGSTDPLVQGRIGTLTEIKNKVDDLITQVQDGAMNIQDIPLTQADIATFLPIMSNLNSPVPQILNTTGMNPVLQNLFQTYSGGDSAGGAAAQEMFDKYAGMLLKNTSWDLNLSYVGEAEQNMTKQEADSITSMVNLLQGSTVVEFDEAPETDYQGQLQDLTQSMDAQSYRANQNGAKGVQSNAKGDQSSAKSVQSAAKSNARDPRLPTPYDWQPRTTQICKQIAARGMTPGDFGCVNPSSVSDNFSWRGNAKMICNRLSTLYDSSIPAACGCPPVGWPGWRA